MLVNRRTFLQSTATSAALVTGQRLLAAEDQPPSEAAIGDILPKSQHRLVGQVSLWRWRSLDGADSAEKRVTIDLPEGR